MPAPRNPERTVTGSFRRVRLNIEDAYWVEAVDRAGNTVATQATKLFDWRETNLADEIRSLRPFFADPAPHLAEGSRIDFKDQGAHAVSGIVVAGGAVWVHPHYRRTGVALVVPKISRAHAYARWPIAGNWAVMEPKTLAQGFAEEHRLSIVGSLVFHLRAWRVDLPCYALWTLRTTALGDLARMIDQAKDTSRRLLTPPTIPV